MSFSAIETKGLNLNGVTYTQQVAQNAPVLAEFNSVVPAAQPGTLTTFTDTSDGTITMSSGSHTVTTGARVDVYWIDTSNVPQCRRGMTVGTVAGTSVPISGGAGTNLPAASTVVNVALPVSLSMPLTGANAEAIGIYADFVGTFVFATAVPAEVFGYTIQVAASSYVWANGDGSTNPIGGGNPTQLFVSHGDPSQARVLRGAISHT
ncbi:hypothetical protein [Fimbriiglobus ruber]|uniref:Uncharacterized protein n=1 Tax=Fimbriiglobus ruber TaxID=1908690 RepID=A0A225D0D4_9BACT|nr:hypothetical protein [Fimbriiglobus ruber]OWK34972.1 hypothetical protein FRUB_09814 [Fimbriiglobus ruber]